MGHIPEVMDHPGLVDILGPVHQAQLQPGLPRRLADLLELLVAAHRHHAQDPLHANGLAPVMKGLTESGPCLVVRDR